MKVRNTLPIMGLIILSFPVVYLTQRAAADANRTAESPELELSATLAAVSPVKTSSLAASFLLMTNPPDTVVPAGLVEFLKDETIIGGNPCCKFYQDQGHPALSWSLSPSSGIYGTPDETQARLTERLVKLGFKPYDSPKKEFPLAFRRDVKGREESVRLKLPGRWVGGRKPTVGIDLEWTIRSAAVRPSPTLAEVFKAMPTLRPPKDGLQPIPDAVLDVLLAERVKSVATTGPGRLWYSLDIELVKPADGARPACVARLAETLKKEKFDELEIKLLPYEGVRIMDMARSVPDTTARCQATVFDREGNFHVSLHVQTGEKP